jgi:predicted DNA-binding protein (MmcQ/YjbR family)
VLLPKIGIMCEIRNAANEPIVRMNIEELRDYCLSLPGTEEGFPFDEVTLVFKVMGKMFALASLEANPLRVNLKCDPDKALVLREHFASVLPGYHMSKKHWNTVIIDGEVNDSQLREWVEESYNLVAASLPKKIQQQLKEL